MPGRRPPCSSSISWGGSKRWSGPEHRRPRKQRRVRGYGSRIVDARELDVNNVVAALPQAPQDETGPDSPDFGRVEFVVDETGLASEEALNLAHRTGPQQEISRVGADSRQRASRTDFTREFSSEQRSRNLHTIAVVEDTNQHAVRQSQLMQFRFIKEEKRASAPPTLHAESPRVTKIRHLELPKLVENYNPGSRANPAAAENSNQPAAGARPLFKPSSRGGKPNSRTLSTFLLAKKKWKSPIPSQLPEHYSRAPHPYDVGKVSHVNICPMCEKYTVTELDRCAAAGAGDDTTLRARFWCCLCREVFDLGIALFDPRGIPGVTLYEGEDRLRPPVPPRGKYPCPRCWKNTHTAFQRMAAYLREESQVRCVPACPAERLDPLSSWGKPEEKTEIEARNAIRTVLGLL